MAQRTQGASYLLKNIPVGSYRHGFPALARSTYLLEFPARRHLIMNALGNNDYFSSCIKQSAHRDIIYWYPPCTFLVAYTPRPDGRHSLNCRKPLLILQPACTGGRAEVSGLFGHYLLKFHRCSHQWRLLLPGVDIPSLGVYTLLPW